MFTKIWIPLLIAVSVINASPSPTPQYSSPEPPRAGGGFYPSSSQRPVYTAQRAREHYSSSPSYDDEPYPSTSNLGTAQTTHGVEEPENTGFVQEPIDFSSLLNSVGTSSSKGLDISASSSNPLFASESKNSFAGFFGSNNKDPFADFGSLATASSDRNSKSPKNEDPAGFVDPNVQFRSLFESSQAANNGFKPEDFLGNKGDSSGAEPSKGSQTRTFPSFTYSGRKEDDYGSNDSPKYRSNYRQVESQDDDYSPSYRGGGQGGGGRDEPSYDDDRNDYGRGGSQDDSPSGPPNRSGPPPPNSRYNQGSSPRYSPDTEETSHRPQASGQRPKTAESSNKNPKCKKVEKNVDYSSNEDYTSFTEPEADYDPSTYRGRYKRQSRQGRQSSRGNKRPMTCYVCEDEQGRYAEKCSYDSKANPNKNEYFHSSSSAYSDNGNKNGNGRRSSGKSDRHRRNPSRQGQKAEASATASTSAESKSSRNDKETSHDIEESEPKILEKRQIGNGDRYASNFGGNDGPRRNSGGRGDNSDRNNNFEFNTAGNGDYDLPRGYLGNNGGRVNEFEGPQSRPTGNNNQGRGSVGDNYGFGGNDNNDRGYGFDNNNNDREFNDFNFGAPSGFGRESSSPSESGSRGTDGRGRGSGGEQGFNNFDFSIPRDYDPDVQLSNSNNNNNNRPSADGSASSSSNRDSFPNNFDVGYDDYVKQYFPGEFGPQSSSSAGPSSSSPSYSPSSGPSISSSPPSYRPRSSSPRENSFNQYNHNNNQNNRPHHHSSSSPDKQHTQPSHNFAPPPNFFNSNPEGFENSQNLHKIMDNFSGKDRSNCQKVQKGDMSCYVCRDAKGMNKEECMYASNDPKNTRMAYHEVTEYSSDPPASVLPLPRPETSHASLSSPGSLQQSGSSPVASSVSKTSVHSSSSPPTTANLKPKPKPTSSGSVTRVESKIVSTKIHHEDKSPVEYDFDY